MKRLLIAIGVLAAVATGCATVTSSSGSSPAFRTWGSGKASKSTAPATTPVPTIPTPPSLSPLPPEDPNAEPVVQVVHRVLPAVVNVTTNLLEPNPLGGSQQGRGVGTGFVIRSDGIVVTNFHVVEGAQRITVTTSTEPTRTFEARVIGGDSEADLAVLKVDATGLPTVRMGDSAQLELGQRVVAVGYALALSGGPTVTSGIVSALDREVKAADPNASGGSRSYTHVIQTDAAINPGNSGGPLVNLQGQVVGINTAGAQQAENIGFAISIDAAKPTIEHAVQNPSAPLAFLGVTTTTVTPLIEQQENLTVDSGAFVIDVAPKGPAEDAGIDSGDVIVKFDDQAVDGSERLGELILAHHPGDDANVTVVHQDGSDQTYHVTLGVRPLPTASP
ncbi:MAG TPA: trypsin-like peptidase domain-containing protein [Actinomycetota bacterium]